MAKLAHDADPPPDLINTGRLPGALWPPSSWPSSSSSTASGGSQSSTAPSSIPSGRMFSVSTGLCSSQFLTLCQLFAIFPMSSNASGPIQIHVRNANFVIETLYMTHVTNSDVTPVHLPQVAALGRIITFSRILHVLLLDDLDSWLRHLLDVHHQGQHEGCQSLPVLLSPCPCFH